jgi:nickel/cobalt transporter (NicO) family protein
MHVALVIGTVAGAVHAIAGPDHVVSLVPLSLGDRERRGWRVGGLWGAGHAVGTAAGVVALWLLARSLELELAAVWGDRLAGLALVAMGLFGLHRWRALRAEALTRPDATHPSLLLGLLHGTLGAAGVLLIVPASFSASPFVFAAWLVGFAGGSTLAMAAMTAALSGTARRASRERLVRVLPIAGAAAALVVGIALVALA